MEIHEKSEGGGNFFQFETINGEGKVVEDVCSICEIVTLTICIRTESKAMGFAQSPGRAGGNAHQ